MIAMGVLMIVGGPLLLQREWRLPLGSRPRTAGAAAAVGAAFAVGWSPCIGPTLASILAIAAAQGRATDGAALLFAYSAGPRAAAHRRRALLHDVPGGRKAASAAPRHHQPRRRRAADPHRHPAGKRPAGADQRPPRPVGCDPCRSRSSRWSGTAPSSSRQRPSRRRSTACATTSSCTPASTTTASSRRCSSTSWACARPITRSRAGSGGHSEQTAAMLASARPRARRRAARPRAGLRRHQLHARRHPGRSQARDPAGPHRVRPSLIRPRHARGDEPGDRRHGLRSALLPQPDRRGEPRRRGHHQRGAHGGRCHGGRCADVRARSRFGARGSRRSWESRRAGTRW